MNADQMWYFQSLGVVRVFLLAKPRPGMKKKIGPYSYNKNLGSMFTARVF